MKRAYFIAAGMMLMGMIASAGAGDTPKTATAPAKSDKPYFTPSESKSSGAVTIGGASINYDAYAGTIIVHAKDFDDAPQTDEEKKKDKNPDAVASMFYVAYFKKGAKPGMRPVTFFYNGGPGSATVWLHMGAFGPRRVVTRDDSHTPAAPYAVVNNDSSLLDASDLVFIDAPGTGFSRIAGKDKKKAFYGVDPDAHAFAEFIKAFLTKYGRWNSPKYLFGESYGTPRSAVVANILQSDDSIDLNGIIMLSQILNFDLSVDEPEFNPGIDTGYATALPTYAATAWYHHKLPGNPKDLQDVIQRAEVFAMGSYSYALAKGSSLSDKARHDIANKLHEFTGLPVDYILRANLRISGGVFEKHLQQGSDMTTGRLDTRFSGPTMDPLSKESQYDPQSAAISSAYVSAFNAYVRETLHYGKDMTFKPSIETWKTWDYRHKPPGADQALTIGTNTMPDLAQAMKYNPDLKILLTGGYYDLATPFYEGWYEMHHLPIPGKLQKNIEYRYYQSGHMIYAHAESLKKLHGDVAAFIRATDNVNGG